MKHNFKFKIGNIVRIKKLTKTEFKKTYSNFYEYKTYYLLFRLPLLLKHKLYRIVACNMDSNDSCRVVPNKQDFTDNNSIELFYNEIEMAYNIKTKIKFIKDLIN